MHVQYLSVPVSLDTKMVMKEKFELFGLVGRSPTLIKYPGILQYSTMFLLHPRHVWYIEVYKTRDHILWIKCVITINVPLFKKLRDIIFFAGQSLYESFQGTFWGGQKSRDPLKMSQEKAHKVIVPTKKFLSQIFLNSGTLVILCLFETTGPQFYSFLTIF